MIEDQLYYSFYKWYSLSVHVIRNKKKGYARELKGFIETGKDKRKDKTRI